MTKHTTPKKDNMHTPTEDWTQVTDRGTRRRIQNRISQQKHRRFYIFSFVGSIWCSTWEGGGEWRRSLRRYSALPILIIYDGRYSGAKGPALAIPIANSEAAS
ncbi:uncharacterized protein BCR38DRAFT_157850 [Pseudomassariella vexata]|uniref:Uncharacterized protein n=1 Tax=Pseudomassariella vexata TaxID=1141098 RepID=A0A1Y2E773_9PEZI|nr:uncharacterized protein BCR38DRAFT_157850 [Pseudomassariella vexata]ORY67423.1 hypothetical protein BCR38DRAFT_157850 [Pseudomassariella vexata]